VVIEVTDDDCPWNTGRWRLRARMPGSAGPGSPAPGSAGPGGAATATCEPTADPADLAMPVTALGAAYLGGIRLGALAAAGLVTELRAGALAAASTAMSWDPAPWCPMVF